jgi:hypothetical protein
LQKRGIVRGADNSTSPAWWSCTPMMRTGVTSYHHAALGPRTGRLTDLPLA